MGDGAFLHDQTQCIKGWFPRHIACQSTLRHGTEIGQAFVRIFNLGQSPAVILPVSNVIAFAAPAIQQPRSFAGDSVEQFGGQREGARPLGNGVPRMDHKGGAIGQSSAAFIAKMLLWGT